MNNVIDYTRIVLYCSKYGEEVIAEYFYSEYLKAKEKFIGDKMFFESINNVITGFILHIKEDCEKSLDKKQLSNHSLTLVELLRPRSGSTIEDFDFLAYRRFNIETLNFIKEKMNETKNKIEEEKALLNNAKEEALDLSDTNASEKTIYLYELGIIEFLRKTPICASSTNKLAEILSAITGENQRTLQSYLNPIINATVDQKKNPYSSKTTVDKVRKQLRDIDYPI